MSKYFLVVLTKDKKQEENKQNLNGLANTYFYKNVIIYELF